MRKGQVGQEQIVAIVREADRAAMSTVANAARVSEQTIYTWRKRFPGYGANATSDLWRSRLL